MAKKKAIAQPVKSEWNRDSEIKQLSLFDPIANGGTKNGSGVPLKSATPEPTPEQKRAWVQIYDVTRRGEKHKYFRFCYLNDPKNIRTLTRVHLPGGNIQNPKAIALKEKVESAIAKGMSARAIMQIIKSSTRS